MSSAGIRRTGRGGGGVEEGKEEWGWGGKTQNSGLSQLQHHRGQREATGKTSKRGGWHRDGG